MRILIIIICLFFIGCTTPCPSERAFFIDTYGQLVYMEKGWFNEKEGRWFTQEEADILIKKYMKEYKQKHGR